MYCVLLFIFLCLHRYRRVLYCVYCKFSFVYISIVFLGGGKSLGIALPPGEQLILHVTGLVLFIIFIEDIESLALRELGSSGLDHVPFETFELPYFLEPPRLVRDFIYFYFFHQLLCWSKPLEKKDVDRVDR